MDYANTLKLASVYCLREAARKVLSHLYRRSEEIHPCFFYRTFARLSRPNPLRASISYDMILSARLRLTKFCT